MTKGWTEERKHRQAKAIQGWKPWARSTGPRSAEGKARVSRNAWRGGERQKLRELSKAFNALFRDQRRQIERLL